METTFSIIGYILGVNCIGILENMLETDSVLACIYIYIGVIIG